MAESFKVENVRFGGGGHLTLIAGPCVIESRAGCLRIARRLKEMADENRIPLVFKASYDKANRSSHTSWRGPGLTEGMKILRDVKDSVGVPVLTDVHAVDEVEPAASVADILQIPAFLCRQTDLLLAAGRTGKAVNVKKGQFMAPWDMRNVIDKIESTGNRRILLTERGTCFGYNNLVADMRSLLVMAGFGYPVVFDATHSVQRPGAEGGRSGGDRQWAAGLARAAVAVGCDAIFLETHTAPAKALSDSDTMLPLREVSDLWKTLAKIVKAVS